MTIHKNDDTGRPEGAVQQVDPADPIFDSETEDEDSYFAKLTPPPTQPGSSYTQALDHGLVPVVQKFSEFAKSVQGVLRDFFASGSTAEIVESLRRLHCSHYLDFFVVKAIRMALDRAQSSQQHTAELFTVLFDSKVLSRAHMCRGFEKLVQSVEDIQLDVPDSADRIMTFLICAVEDQLVGENFVRRLPEGFLSLLTPLSHENEAVVAQLDSLQRFKVACMDFEGDFFNTGTAGEVRSFFAEHPSFLRHELVRHLVKTSLSKTDWEREMVSAVLSECYGGSGFSPDDVQLAFSRLVGSTDDLLLDCPNAQDFLSKFIVRAVVDEVLPPVFVKHQKRLHVGGVAGFQILSKVQGWLKNKRGHMLSQQFRKVWTGTDPSRQEARDFKKEARDTIFEFFDTRDTAEATRCLREMDLTPDQTTEFCRKLMIFAMERNVCEGHLAISLLVELLKQGEIKPENVANGFDDLYKTLSDLVLDIPNAADQVKFFRKLAEEKNILPPNYEDVVTKSKKIESTLP